MGNSDRSDLEQLHAAFTERVEVKMSTEWMIEGYVLAADRFNQAAQTTVDDAREPSIALAEALTWLDILQEAKLLLAGEHADLRALRFVRNRTHHHRAAAIYRDSEDGAWKWLATENIPAPRRNEYSGKNADKQFKRDRDSKGERIYKDQLSGYPVRLALERLRAAVKLIPQSG